MKSTIRIEFDASTFWEDVYEQRNLVSKCMDSVSKRIRSGKRQGEIVNPSGDVVGEFTVGEAQEEYKVVIDAWIPPTPSQRFPSGPYE